MPIPLHPHLPPPPPNDVPDEKWRKTGWNGVRRGFYFPDISSGKYERAIVTNFKSETCRPKLRVLFFHLTFRCFFHYFPTFSSKSHQISSNYLEFFGAPSPLFLIYPLTS